MCVTQVRDYVGDTFQLTGSCGCPGNQTDPANPESSDPVVEGTIIGQKLKMRITTTKRE